MVIKRCDKHTQAQGSIRKFIDNFYEYTECVNKKCYLN